MMSRPFAYLVAALLLMAGCTQQAPTAPPAQPPSAPPAAPPPAMEPPSAPPAQPPQVTPPASGSEWKTYGNIGLTFDYPADMKAQENLGSYMGGKGYATVTMQSSDNSIIIVNYVNLSGASGNGANATGLLESDNKGTDPLGVLHQATSKGTVRTLSVPAGLDAAELEFSVEDPASDKAFTGYALQFYDETRGISVGVRIMSLNGQEAKDMRDRFVSSFRLE